MEIECESCTRLRAELAEKSAWQEEIRGAIDRSGMGIMRTSQGPIGTMIGYRPEVEEEHDRKTLEVIHENVDLTVEVRDLKKELAEEKRKVAKLEQGSLDNAEDWALCGINPNSETAKRLVAHHYEREQQRKDSESLALLDKIATVDWPFGNTAIITARIEINEPFATRPTVRTALAALTTPSEGGEL